MDCVRDGRRSVRVRRTFWTLKMFAPDSKYQFSHQTLCRSPNCDGRSAQTSGRRGAERSDGNIIVETRAVQSRVSRAREHCRTDRRWSMCTIYFFRPSETDETCWPKQIGKRFVNGNAPDSVAHNVCVCLCV